MSFRTLINLSLDDQSCQAIPEYTRILYVHILGVLVLLAEILGFWGMYELGKLEKLPRRIGSDPNLWALVVQSCPRLNHDPLISGSGSDGNDGCDDVSS